MPTYDYDCEKCGGSFEAFQSMKDEPFEVCPRESCVCDEWGQGKVRRRLGTGAGLIFKGSGFYTTDYRSESYRQAEKKESEKPRSDAGESGGASEKKPPPAKSDSSTSD